MKKLSLQLRITLLCALVLIAITAILTAVAVGNAQKTYKDQFEIKFGNAFSIRVYDDEIVFDGIGGNALTNIFRMVNELTDNEDEKVTPSVGIFGQAGKEFAKESLVFMILFVIIGIILTYFLVRRALSPIRELSHTVNEINQNNLYQKIDISPAKDEISSLTASFNDMLERLNQAFTMQKNFAANAAHELRTPLSTMKAAVQVLEMDEEPSLEDYKETIEIVKKSTDRMIKVVNDLLELSKSEQCDFSNYVDLSKILQEVAQELDSKAKEAQVTIELGNLSGNVIGNETLIYRAFFNLVENAIKYNRNGGRIFIQSEIKDHLNYIRIKDNGIGIPKDALEHIFEPFYRVDKARSRAIGGSGLGLTLVKDIIEKHDGRINVISHEGEGTTFTVELPYCKK